MSGVEFDHDLTVSLVVYLVDARAVLRPKPGTKPVPNAIDWSCVGAFDANTDDDVDVDAQSHTSPRLAQIEISIVSPSEKTAC